MTYSHNYYTSKDNSRIESIKNALEALPHSYPTNAGVYSFFDLHLNEKDFAELSKIEFQDNRAYYDKLVSANTKSETIFTSLNQEFYQKIADAGNAEYLAGLTARIIDDILSAGNYPYALLDINFIGTKCNSVNYHPPADWHTDSSPDDEGPKLPYVKYSISLLGESTAFLDQKSEVLAYFSNSFVDGNKYNDAYRELINSVSEEQMHEAITFVPHGSGAMFLAGSEYCTIHSGPTTSCERLVLLVDGLTEENMNEFIQISHFDPEIKDLIDGMLT